MADDKTRSVPTRSDSRNFSIDPIEIFNTHIKGIIDNLRSEISIDKNKNNLTSSLIKESFSGTPVLGGYEIEDTLQESRCHAFYRYIGLPVVSKNKEIYNPGHDITKESYSFKDKKGEIASNPLNGFDALSSYRENWSQLWLNVFSNANSLAASISVLSLVNNREFSSTLPSDAGLDSKFSIKNEIYEIDDDSIVGLNNVKYSEYVDEFGNAFNDSSGAFNQRVHIIAPFIVDARIDRTVPNIKKVAVPFVLDNRHLIVGDLEGDTNILASRPIIEDIIIERFTKDKVRDAKPAGERVKQTLEDLKNIESIKDEQIISDISAGKIYKSSQQQQFIFYFNVINNMMQKLAEAKKVIKSVQSEYYYLPIPNELGPENGISIRNPFAVIYAKKIEKLQTELDKDLISSTLRDAYSKINAEFNNSKKTDLPNLGKNNVNKFPIIFNNQTVSSAQATNYLEQAVTNLSKKRADKFTKANQALQLIEIITGEFSGFGLCDMIAILGGLYLMPENSLLGFLDPESYKRATMHPELKNGVIPQENPSDINTAINDLSKNVQALYDIMDALLEDEYDSY